MTKTRLFSIMTILLYFAISFKANAQWQAVNGKGGCVVRSFASKGSTIFVGTNDGIILSNDSGATWVVADSGITDTNITSIILSDSILFASAYNTGIFRSTDNGASWRKVAAYFGLNTLSNMGSIVLAGGNGATYCSRDLGLSWKQLGINPDNSSAFSGDDIFSIINCNGTLLVGTDHGLFASQDTGTKWQSANVGIPSGSQILSFAILGNYLFAGTDTSGVFASTDKGVTWIRKTSILHKVSAFTISGSNLFAATDSGIYYSKDSGNNWVSRNKGLSNLEVESLVFFGKAFFVGTSGDGIFGSNDSSTTWSSINSGVTGLDIRTIFHSEKYLYVGSEWPYYGIAPGGLLESTDNGLTYKTVNLDLDAPTVFSFNSSGTNVFMETSSGIFLSTDTDSTWTQRDFGKNTYSVLGLTTVGNYLYGACFDYGVCVSRDTGSSWFLSDSGLTTTQVLRVATLGPVIFAGTYSGVFRSVDSGVSWSQVNNGLLDTLVLSLAVLGGNLFAGTEGGVFLSTDSGLTWKAVNNDLPQTSYIYSFAIDGSHLFASATNTVYLTNDSGSHWINCGEGLPTLQYFFINNLALSDSFLFAQSFHENNSTIWRRPLSQLFNKSSDRIGFTEPQYQISVFPNPTTGLVTLTGVSGTVTIENMLGECVLRQPSTTPYPLLEKEGESVTLDLSHEPSGIYFVRVETANGTEQQKIVKE